MDKQTLHVVCDVLSQCDQPFVTQLFSVCLLTDLKLSVLSVSDYSINISIFIQCLHERTFSFFEFYSLLVRPFVPILTHAKLFLGVNHFMLFGEKNLNLLSDLQEEQIYTV